MSLLQVEIISQATLLVQILLLLAGIALVLAGRYLFFAMIFASGFISGLWAGFVFLFPLYSATAFAATQGPFISGVVGVVIVLISGLISAAITMAIYVTSIQLIGAIAGFAFCTLLFGFDPGEMLYGMIRLLLTMGIGFFIGMIPVLAAGFGVYIISISVANLTGNDAYLHRLAEFWDDTIEDYRNGTVGSVLAILFGLFSIAVGIGSLIWPYSRNIILSTAELLINPGMPVIPFAVTGVGIVVGAIAIWKLHELLVIVKTSFIGAILVSVSTVADQFITALLNVDIKAAAQMIEVFSIIFLGVLVFGIAVQSGMLYYNLDSQIA